MFGPLSSLFPRLLEAVARDAWTRKLLELVVAGPAIGWGAKNLLDSEPNYLAAFLGLAIGITTLLSTFSSSIASKNVELLSWIFVGGSAERFLDKEYRVATLLLLLGAPPLLTIYLIRQLPAYQKFTSFGYGAFLGPIICYSVIVMNMDLDHLGLIGYFIALLLGICFAAYMPTIYILHGNRPSKRTKRAPGEQQFLDIPSMIPLTFSAGIIAGFGITSILFASRLMLLFGPPGYVAALAIDLIVLYALNPL